MEAFYSTQLGGVPSENRPHILEKIGNAKEELVWLENYYNVATLKNDVDFIAERAVQSIRERL